MREAQTGSLVFALLRWSCVALFLGRAWQHLRWDAPYRAFLWSQETLEPLVTGLFGVPWETYATSPAVATGIAAGVQLVGLFYFVCAFAAWRCERSASAVSTDSAAPAASAHPRWAHRLLIAGSVGLTFLAYCSYRDRVYRVGEFFDLACQFALPLLLALTARRALSARHLLVAIRVAVACTFGAHGLKAVGIYPVPGEWITMTIAATGVSEAAAFTFLKVAGLLDFAIVAAVMVPWIRLDRAAFAYAAAWGLLTALARPVAFIRWDNFADSAAQWLHEGIMRLPHAALPLAGFLILRALATARADTTDLVSPSFALPRIHNTPSC